MKKTFLFAIILMSTRLISQIIISPTTAIPCNEPNSYVNFTVTTGTAPYSIFVQSPSCTTSYTLSSLAAQSYFYVSCEGVYTITINDASTLFSTSITHTATLATFIDAGIIGDVGNDTICLGTMSNLVASGIPSTFINPVTWNTGETTEMIAISPTTSTSYSYSGVFNSVPLSRTCTAIGTTTIFVIPCNNGVGIKDLTQLDFKIYPNPIKDILYLEFEQSATKLKITNALGQTVFVLNEPLPKQEVDLSFLSSGIYYLKVWNQDGQQITKILKSN